MYNNSDNKQISCSQEYKRVVSGVGARDPLEGGHGDRGLASGSRRVGSRPLSTRGSPGACLGRLSLSDSREGADLRAGIRGDILSPPARLKGNGSGL